MSKLTTPETGETPTTWVQKVEKPKRRVIRPAYLGDYV